MVEPMPPYNAPLALGPGGVPMLLDVTGTPLTVALPLVPTNAFTPNPVRSLVELNQWMTPTLLIMVTAGLLIVGSVPSMV